MLCKICGKEFPDEGIDTCKDCLDRLSRHIKNAKEAISEYDFRRAAEELDAALSVAPSFEEALHLKKETEEKIIFIEEKKRELEQFSRQSKYKEAIDCINEILAVKPDDEDTRLQKNMLEVLMYADPQTYKRREQKKYSPADYIKRDYKTPPSWAVAAGAAGILVAFVAFGNYLYKSRIERLTAAQLYNSLQEKMAKRDYYSDAFIEEYEKLVRDYGHTEYAKDLEKEISLKRDAMIKRYLDNARVFMEKEMYKEVLEQCSKVLAIDALNYEARRLSENARDRMSLKKLKPLRFAHINGTKGLEGQIEQDAADISSEMPDDAKEFLLRGQQYIARGEIQLAIKEWEKARGALPDARRGKIEQLIRKANLIISQREKDFAILVEQGDKRLKEGDMKAALFSFESALRLHPEDKDLAEKVRQLRSAVGLPVGVSIDEIIRPAKVRPKDILRFTRNEIRKKLAEGRYKKVKALLNKAISYEESKDFKSAASYYKRLYTLTGKREYLVHSRVDYMIKFLKDKLKRHPGDNLLSISLGCMFYANGWYDMALDTWDAVISGAGDDPAGIVALSLKAATFEEMQETEAARTIYEDILQKGDIFYVRNSLAKILWHEGFYTEAILQWENIAGRLPYELDVINALASAYILFGRDQDAVRLLDSISKITPFNLRQSQHYPFEVDPLYIAGVVGEDFYFSEETRRLSEIFASIGYVAESIRWHRISEEVQK